jgi:tubulin monoglycylase TTLL3/8
MVNHYSRNGCFTTKVGLCSSLRNLPWFHSGCADEFYPRCYKLTHEDDKVAFIGKNNSQTNCFDINLLDDYRLTSCLSFLKLAYNRSRGIIEPDMNSILAMSSDNRTDPALNSDEEPQLMRANTILGKISSTKKVPSSTIEFALNNVEQFTLARDHEDIDINLNTQEETTDEQWTQFIEQFYAAAQ